jgi:hypothetical protein
MKLWVDDIRNAPDDSWTVARTVTSAIRAIARYDFDEISLDHDISHQVTVGALGRPYPCEETFMAVAYFIAQKYTKNIPAGYTRTHIPHESYQQKKPNITIHSSNTVAGEEMKKVLHDAGFSQIDHVPMGLANRLEMELP